MAFLVLLAALSAPFLYLLLLHRRISTGFGGVQCHTGIFHKRYVPYEAILGIELFSYREDFNTYYRAYMRTRDGVLRIGDGEDYHNLKTMLGSRCRLSDNHSPLTAKLGISVGDFGFETDTLRESFACDWSKPE